VAEHRTQAMLPPGFLRKGSEQDVAEMFVPALKATSMLFRQCCDVPVDTCEHRFARLVEAVDAG
jgi:hypothetical protein